MRTLSLLALLAGIAGAANAQIYTWTDAQGRVHFGDSPPKDQTAERVVVKPNTYSTPSMAGRHDLGASPEQVVIYTTTWCGVCKKAKGYFKRKQIPYTEYDVEKSRKGRRDYKKLKGKGVPIILVGEQRMNGFSAARFQSMYDKQR